jgi:hypothetical protein
MTFYAAAFIPDSELLGTLHKFAAHQSSAIIVLQKIVQTADGIRQGTRMLQHQRVEGTLKALARQRPHAFTWRQCHSRPKPPQGAPQGIFAAAFIAELAGVAHHIVAMPIRELRIRQKTQLPQRQMQGYRIATLAVVQQGDHHGTRGIVSRVPKTPVRDIIGGMLYNAGVICQAAQVIEFDLG